MSKKSPLTHLNERSEAHMVDISAKPASKRVAIAQGVITGSPATISAIFDDDLKKGDALAVARIAGIMGAKKTPDLIPLCHPISLSHVEIEISQMDEVKINIIAKAETVGNTGVEMEALTAVSIACLTIYDMAKSMDKAMEIGEIKLLKKSGGKSGDFEREI
ncbi:Cyclic pyranopterin monophosphate synthase accessory protein [hydrothermal vent metagenome]|uniref:cyclic pyranopterin monophosphate synthase n=1 Tax=hydrothermal vent metagenome TaxID=652676 RepID=A0A3B0UXE0_9ZZZZ